MFFLFFDKKKNPIAHVIPNAILPSGKGVSGREEKGEQKNNLLQSLFLGGEKR
jgi:hypothetical protein